MQGQENKIDVLQDDNKVRQENKIDVFQDDIKVRLRNGSWVEAHQYQKDAYRLFKKGEESRPYEHNHDDGEHKFTIKRIDAACYLQRENATKMPIADWKDVQKFQPVHIVGGMPKLAECWSIAPADETWAYFDFMYDASVKSIYYTKGIDSNAILTNFKEVCKNENGTDDPKIVNKIVEVTCDEMSPQYIFALTKNGFGFVSLKTCEEFGTVISDCSYSRLAHSKFFVGMTFNR